MDRHKGKFGAWQSLNFGYEGHSKLLPTQEMNRVHGNRREYAFVLFILLLGCSLPQFRRANEEGLAAEIKASNTYSRLNLDDESSKPFKWAA